ncbi:uncharacterized protein LOC141655292 [Silene latifolia]|uniref:uncharacterized protein LOC141655292 n=1 Tax=Silene latifolia TaxID=37657 RepID=UPI003D773367
MERRFEICEVPNQRHGELRPSIICKVKPTIGGELLCSLRRKDGGAARRKGRIFVLSRADAEANPDVITGTYLVSGRHAFILFDTGASISVISSKFAEKASLVSIPAEPVPISLPSGEAISCVKAYVDVPILIAGEIGWPFMTLVSGLRSEDFLEESCGPSYPPWWKTSEGIKIVSALKLMSLQRKGCQVFLCSVSSSTELPELKEVRIVNEYPDVFPEDLPGIPPERDVEFSIDPVPNGPIAKAPYRMAPAELQESEGQMR